jgi:hypothetical protein
MWAVLCAVLEQPAKSAGVIAWRLRPDLDDLFRGMGAASQIAFQKGPKGESRSCFLFVGR